jgi:hypothetical protein
MTSGCRPSTTSASTRAGTPIAPGKEAEILPFDHIDASLGKRFLWADQRRAWREKVMEDCAIGKCAGCVACDDEIEHVLAKDQPGAVDGIERYPAVFRNPGGERGPPRRGRSLEDPDEESMLRAAASRYHERRERIIEEALAEGETEDRLFTRFQPAPKYQPAREFVEPPRVQRLRVTYTKLGVLRYLGHLDLSKVIGIVLRRANAPISYSEGFNSKPRVQFPPPLGLGVGGAREAFDVLLAERVDPATFCEACAPCRSRGWIFSPPRKSKCRPRRSKRRSRLRDSP